MDQFTGYYDDPEAPELTEAEIDAAYQDALEQTAPPIAWDTCYCDADNMCTPCADALAFARSGYRRAA